MASDHTKLPSVWAFPRAQSWGPFFLSCTQPLFEVIKKHSIQHHAFADDNQLYNNAVPDQTQTTIEIKQNCITDVKLWMTHNKRQLNDSKAE